MTRISQLIAVVSGVKADTTAQMGELAKKITTEALTQGQTVTYRPRFEDSDQSPQALALLRALGGAGGEERPEKSTRVRVTAEGTLDEAAKLVTRLLDVTRTLDEANAGARANVVVGSKTVLEGVPTTHLLYLEQELKALQEFVAKFPVLDQAETWGTEGTEPGVSKTPLVEVQSTKRVNFNHVKWQPPSPEYKQEAQVEVLGRDEVVGYKGTVKFSGALDPKRKRLLLDRLTQLREAVKFAREEANSAVIEDKKEGGALFSWWLRP